MTQHSLLALCLGGLISTGSLSLKASDLSPSEASRLISRSEQQVENTWNLQALYPGMKEWHEAFQKELFINYDALVSEFKSSKKLTPQELRRLLDLHENLERNLDKLYTYAWLNYVQDVMNREASEAYQAVTTRRYAFFKAMAWINAKILSHSIDSIEEFTRAQELAPYAIFLTQLMNLKPHTLSEEQESLLALSEQATGTPAAVYERLTNADLTFPAIEDSHGEKHPLSPGTYWHYMRSPDRLLRKNAFETFSGVYKEHENTFAQLLYGEIQRHIFYAKARGYSSCLEAALYPAGIPPSVYRGLIETVRKNIDVLHRYISLLKKYDQLERVHAYDFYFQPREKTAHYSYDDAVALILKACQPLGAAYVNRLKEGLTVDRWVDRYENAHKRSGAFSNGCYDSPPYIQVSYAGNLNDVYMLAHEAGHSMHSELSRTQPYQNSCFPVYKYPFFVAEVASTFHEDLLSHLLLQKSQSDPKLQLTIVREKLGNIVFTFFSQVLFADFELLMHERVEKGEPISAKMLREKFQELYEFYYGKDFESDEAVSLDWAGIPHFYYTFYMYQYATGMCAAQALAEKVLNGGEEERDAYLNFLKAGRSKNSLDLLQTAGVDITKPEPIEQAILRFDHLLDSFEKLINDTNQAEGE